MNKISKQKRKITSKVRRREQVRWMSSLTCVLILIVAGWIVWEGTRENQDLSLIGQGQNVVVQVHDPGWGSCRELKRVVNSLENEFEGKIIFLDANLSTKEGRLFAELNNSSRVTLLFFNPDGTRIRKLTGIHEPDYLRRVLNRVFKLNWERFAALRVSSCSSDRKNPANVLDIVHPELEIGGHTQTAGYVSSIRIT